MDPKVGHRQYTWFCSLHIKQCVVASIVLTFVKLYLIYFQCTCCHSKFTHGLSCPAMIKHDWKMGSQQRLSTTDIQILQEVKLIYQEKATLAWQMLSSLCTHENMVFLLTDTWSLQDQTTSLLLFTLCTFTVYLQIFRMFSICCLLEINWALVFSLWQLCTLWLHLIV